jgi:hypothetical protein
MALGSRPLNRLVFPWGVCSCSNWMVICMNLKMPVVLSIAGASLVGFINTASAEVPAAVTSALTAAGADAVTVATAVLVVIVGIIAFKFIRKALS